MRTKQIFILLAILFFGLKISAQNPIETKVDTTQIKIGDSFILTLKAHAKQGQKVLFPESDTFGNFDVLETQVADTILRDQMIELIKNYELTNFDEGDFTLPSLPIIIDSNIYKTDSLNIQVQTVVVDTLKTPMYDIKSISKQGASFSTYWYYIIFIVLSILTGVVTYFYIKWKQEQSLTPEDKYKTPYERAVKKLKKLEEKKNWTRGDAKPYYSDMSDIVRTFLEDTFDISARELTTHEIIALLKATLKDKSIKIKPELINEFKYILGTSDLVKFAKSQPDEFQISKDTQKMQSIVDDINYAYPISAATQTERIRLRELRKRKRLRFRKYVPIAITSVLLVITGITYLYNTSSEREYSLFTFNNTSKLLNKTWVNSTYGINPGITISTPIVLTRKFDPTISEGKPDGVESITLFKFNSLEDPLYVVVGNIATNKDLKYTQKELIKHMVSILTQNYKVEDIQYQESVFENAHGSKGTKITGSFNFIDHNSNTKEKITLEGVLTQNGSNYDLVWISHNTQDQNMQELVNRILDSIEYKKIDK